MESFRRRLYLLMSTCFLSQLSTLKHALHGTTSCFEWELWESLVTLALAQRSSKSLELVELHPVICTQVFLAPQCGAWPSEATESRETALSRVILPWSNPVLSASPAVCLCVCV